MSAVCDMLGSMPSRDTPEALSGAVVSYINSENLDGLLGLYEESAVLELPDGQVAVGRAQIRAYYADLLRDHPRFAPGRVLPALVSEDLALTTTQIGLSASVEVARRQQDGSWRWVVDRPDVLRRPVDPAR